MSKPDETRPDEATRESRSSSKDMTAGCRGRRLARASKSTCAIAIWRFRDARWPRPDGGWWRCLDYQFPLKAEQANAGVGKVDLLGVTESGRLVVSELKVPPVGKGRGKGPMDALMQALGYAAIVEANSTTIGEEAMDVFGVPSISEEPPMLQILAPKDWWRRLVSDGGLDPTEGRSVGGQVRRAG